MTSCAVLIAPIHCSYKGTFRHHVCNIPHSSVASPALRCDPALLMCTGGLTSNDFIVASKINDVDLRDLLQEKKKKFWA